MYKAVIQPRNENILIKCKFLETAKSNIALSKEVQDSLAKDFIENLTGPQEVIAVGSRVNDIVPGEVIGML
jgi:hypothetical protein